MATVNGWTKEKTEAFAANLITEVDTRTDQNVVGGFVDINGRLILQRRNLEQFDAGNVYRPEGFPTYDGGTIDHDALPNDFPFGITVGQADADFPTAYGVVEVVNRNENRCFQRFTEKDGDVRQFVRGAAANVWTSWRAVGKTAGDISLTARATAPTGAVIADGSAISRVLNPRLYEAIGTQFGAGDGSTTFNVPDLRGRVPVGISTDEEFNVRGETGGSKTHTLTPAEIPEVFVESNEAGYSTRLTRGQYNIGGLSSGKHRIAFNDSNSTSYEGVYSLEIKGGGGSHNNLQPYMALHYIIWI